MRSNFIEALKRGYQSNRVDELWGTTAYSDRFFDDWRTDGFWRAFAGLVEAQKQIGTKRLPPTFKALVTLTASGLLACGGILDDFGLTEEQKALPKRPFEPFGVFTAMGSFLLLSGRSRRRGQANQNNDETEASKYKVSRFGRVKVQTFTGPQNQWNKNQNTFTLTARQAQHVKKKESHSCRGDALAERRSEVNEENARRSGGIWG